MASKHKKPSESEVALVAIYRLKFYKNQKNWKFCQDVCKKETTVPKNNKEPAKNASSSKADLNKTYNLVPEPVLSDLNDAFLDPDPRTPPDPITTQILHNCQKAIPEAFLNKWSESDNQWPESDNQWPEPDNQWEDPKIPWPESQYQWLEPEKQWPEPEKQWPDLEKQCPEVEKQWPDVTKSWTNTNKAWSVPEMPEHGWQYAAQEWARPGSCVPAAPLRAYEMDKGWPEPCADDNPYPEPLQPEAVLNAADDWLGDAQRWPTGEDGRCMSSDSMVSFMRGAAAAPHSTEVDLNLSATSEPDVFSARAACLSRRQLAGAVRSHALALRLLLREASAREQAHILRATHTTPHECPTRDVGPQPRGACGDGAGRGRGRLQRDRIIGIGMGRPYRL
ncbi:uncharacterized protein LOC114365541 isoform X2 [Ostrinia furnacalis]|uniref:uncharacterized protein LOC114365541 isoform X2 n=1 Tax=Ostrinia furnacalis TaxID=93504 RepID=UPI00103B3DEB|nr:uncharacterized protein LOC114365541 isoform X2 [Ostrinia furnacalis]